MLISEASRRAILTVQGDTGKGLKEEVRQFRYGSFADVPLGLRYVRVALRSRHRDRLPSCQLWAISGLMHRSKKRLFDHLVGELLQLQGHLKAERFGCREVDNQIEFSWLLYRKLRGLGSAQYLIH